MVIESDYGISIRTAFDARANALAKENERLEAELKTEEQDLTELRKTLEPDEFRALAIAFDEKATSIRNGQRQKFEDYGKDLETARTNFFFRVGPILRQLMQENGIQFILNEQSVLLSSGQGDITDTAIQRINDQLPAEMFEKN